MLSWGLDEPEIKNEKGWGQPMVGSFQTKNSNLKITRFQKEKFHYISWKGNQKHHICDSIGQRKIKTHNFKQNFKTSKNKFGFKI